MWTTKWKFSGGAQLFAWPPFNYGPAANTKINNASINNKLMFLVAKTCTCFIYFTDFLYFFLLINKEKLDIPPF